MGDYPFYLGWPVVIPYPAYFFVIAKLKHPFNYINSMFLNIYDPGIGIPEKGASEFHMYEIISNIALKFNETD